MLQWKKRDLGRRYPDIPDEFDWKGALNPKYEKYSSALIAMPRVIKNTLFAYHNWIDLDMVKGHPSIIYELGRANGLEMNGFRAYLESFETTLNTYRSTLIEFYQADDSPVPLTDSHIKDLMNITIYGGGQSTWVKQIETGVYKNELGEVTSVTEVKPKLKNKTTKHKFYKQFEDDARKVMTRIYNQNEELQEVVCKDILRKEIGEHNGKKRFDDSTEHKRMRRVMSYFCGIVEFHITATAYAYLADNKRKFIKNQRVSWGHDGLTFPAPEGVDIDKMVRQMNKHIQKEIGGVERIRFIHKKFKEDEILSTLIEARKQLPEHVEIINPETIRYTSGGNVTSKIEQQLVDFHQVSFDEFKVIHEQNKFLSSEALPETRDHGVDLLRQEAGLTEDESNDIFYMCKYLVLQAIMGGGKTTALKRLIKRYFDNSTSKHVVLWVSPRVAFSYFIESLFAEFNPFLYLKIHRNNRIADEPETGNNAEPNY